MTLTANEHGEIRGKFRIPPDVPSGAKAVVFTGRGGSSASASFVGQGQMTVQNIVQAQTITRYWTEPLAQTIALSSAAQISGVDINFTATGDIPVSLQVRDTDKG